MDNEKVDIKEYHEWATSLAIYPEDYKIIYPAMKLAGEAGEASEKAGKVLRDNKGEFTEEKKQEIAKELGDVLWYISNFAEDLGYSLEDVAKLNIEKLSSRKERGKLQGSGDNR